MIEQLDFISICLIFIIFILLYYFSIRVLPIDLQLISYNFNAVNAVTFIVLRIIIFSIAFVRYFVTDSTDIIFYRFIITSWVIIIQAAGPIPLDFILFMIFIIQFCIVITIAYGSTSIGLWLVR